MMQTGFYSERFHVDDPCISWCHIGCGGWWERRHWVFLSYKMESNGVDASPSYWCWVEGWNSDTIWGCKSTLWCIKKLVLAMSTLLRRTIRTIVWYTHWVDHLLLTLLAVIAKPMSSSTELSLDHARVWPLTHVRLFLNKKQCLVDASLALSSVRIYLVAFTKTEANSDWVFSMVPVRGRWACWADILDNHMIWRCPNAFVLYKTFHDVIQRFMPFCSFNI